MNLLNGSKGSEVEQLQIMLMSLGYSLPQYGADGMFGSETENAVKQFQQDNGFSVTGIVDDTMWNLLLKKNGSITKSAGFNWKSVLIPVGILALIGLGILTLRK